MGVAYHIFKCFGRLFLQFLLQFVLLDMLLLLLRVLLGDLTSVEVDRWSPGTSVPSHFAHTRAGSTH